MSQSNNAMLVEFRVKNFRCLRDEQVLSLVASADNTLRDTHTLPTGLKAAPALLRSAVLYGANASGKSTLINALQYMRGVVVESALVPPGQTFAVPPFRLDAESAARPTEFEVTFLRAGVRYQYGFAMTPQRILREHLLVYKACKPQRWFTRRFDAETGNDLYDFGPGLKGAKNLWEGATRPNALFLSMAVQLNSEALQPVFDWFANQLVIFNEQARLKPQISIQRLKQPEGRKAICDFLAAADISIADIDVVTRKVPGQAVHFDLVAGKTEVRNEEVEQHQLRFHHVTDQGQVAGTQGRYCYPNQAPWSAGLKGCPDLSTPKATWMSFRIMAPMITMGGLPAAARRSRNAFPQPVLVMVTMAGMYNAFRKAL